MVTAELAVALPVLIVVLGAALSVIGVASARTNAQDAARESARSVARGGHAVTLPDIAVTTTTTTDEVVAVASVRVHMLVSLLPAVTVTERSVAAREPSATQGGSPVGRPP